MKRQKTQSLRTITLIYSAVVGLCLVCGAGLIVYGRSVYRPSPPGHYIDIEGLKHLVAFLGGIGLLLAGVIILGGMCVSFLTTRKS